MVNPPISGSTPTLFGDTRARASRWTGQLGQLFGWLLVIEFGLMSVALGLMVMDWSQTPDFLASAAGAWLLLLAGCRGLAALAQTPSRSRSTGRPAERPTSPRSDPARSVWTRSVSPTATSATSASSTSFAGSPASSVAKRVAVVEVASCFGTGIVLVQADWAARPAAVPIALTFAGMAVIVCAALDVLIARFSAEGYPRQRLIRAGAWTLSAVLLMILIRDSAPAALGIAAVVIGLVETGLGGWLLNRAAEERRARVAADPLSLDDAESREDVDHGPLVGFLTGADADPDADSTRDFWPWAVPSETG